VIGRAHHVVLDCPDPAALAAFYAELLGLHVTYRSVDWVVVAQRPDTSGYAFQLAHDHRAPEWVDDVAAAEPKVEALGARRLASEHGSVWADPAGHPFCLIPRPGWAPVIGG
jgi:catechol 2,3-dioxygenase-like lactoylglutathione lyase family enzyme